MFNDFGVLIAKYNSTLPTLTTGDLVELQVDSSGRLLVQADVSVIIDFLGLNSSGDSSNILVVGTEDGTGTGTPHAFRLTSNGSVVIADGGGSITVDGSVTVVDGGGSITIDGTIGVSGISDGTNSLDINADGSINVIEAIEGAEEFATADALVANADGLVAVTASFADVASISLAEDDVLHVYGWSFSCDKNASGRIILNDGTDTYVYKIGQVTSAMPNLSEFFGKEGRIEITAAIASTVKLQVATKNGSGSAGGSLHSRKIAA